MKKYFVNVEEKLFFSCDYNDRFRVDEAFMSVNDDDG